MLNEDVLRKWAPKIAWAERHARGLGTYLRCIQDLATALRAERERVAELEADAANWRKVEAMPMNFRLAHEPVLAFPGDDDWDTKRHYEWAVLYQSVFTSNGATPQEALDRAMNNPQRWVPDFVLTMWRQAIKSEPKEET
jgi:hypothetical protein